MDIRLEQAKRLVLWANNKKQYPENVEISITNKCNLQCRYCWQRNYLHKSKELETENSIRIIKKLGKAKVNRISITGGEPLCRRDIGFILKTIKKEGIDGHLLTNGTLFDEEIVKLIIGIGWDLVVISLDSHKAKVNDMLRGEGSFKKIIENIKLFNKLKSDKESKPHLMLSVTITKKNYKHIPKIVKLAKELGIKELSVLPIIAYHKTGSELRVDVKKEKVLHKYLTKAYELSKEYNIKSTIKELIDKKIVEKSHNMDTILKEDRKINLKFNPACFHPFLTLIIKEDGTISPCSISGIRGEKFEKNKSLNSLWFGRTFTSFRHSLLKNKIPPCCSICCGQKIIDMKYLPKKIIGLLEKEDGRKSKKNP